MSMLEVISITNSERNVSPKNEDIFLYNHNDYG